MAVLGCVAAEAQISQRRSCNSILLQIMTLMRKGDSSGAPLPFYVATVTVPFVESLII
jgi:hypothetical protein